MTSNAQTILKRTLSQLEAQHMRIGKEIRAVQAALKALGVPFPRLAARRRRGPIGPAERRAISKRMKAYWAKKRMSRA